MARVKEAEISGRGTASVVQKWTVPAPASSNDVSRRRLGTGGNRVGPDPRKGGPGHGALCAAGLPAARVGWPISGENSRFDGLLHGRVRVGGANWPAEYLGGRSLIHLGSSPCESRQCSFRKVIYRALLPHIDRIDRHRLGCAGA
jgi:hypothetical protein